MRIFSNKRSTLMFTCPKCHNDTMVDVDRDVYNVHDIDYHDVFVCGECGEERYGEVQYDGQVKFVSMHTVEESMYVEASNDTISKSKLESELQAKLKEVMIANGFEESGSAGWDEYSRVDIYPFDEDRVKIEVGAELSYDSIVKLARELDPIVEKLDKYAYFDVEDSGILVAVVDKNSIEASETIESAYGGLEPDYGDEPNYLDDEEEELEVYIKTKVRVEDDDFEFIGDQQWAESDDGAWESEEYPGVELIADADLIEQAYYALWPYLPDDPGDYSITCYMTIPFVISNIRYEGRVGDMETITDEAEVHIDSTKDVEIEGFQFRKA